MGGTVEGGRKAAIKNLASDPNFYRKIGKIGGKLGRTGGFHVNRELARTAGSTGGSRSRRGYKLVLADAYYGIYRDRITNEMITINYKRRPTIFQRMLAVVGLV